MPAGAYNISCEQGATLSRTLVYRDAADVPIPLGGYTAKMEVRDPVTRAVAATLSTADGSIVLGGPAGTVALVLTATATNALTPGVYIYDLELTSGTVVTRMIEGTFNVRPQVTL